MATARKTKSGNYRCLAYAGKDESGKRIYKSFTAKTKKEAERFAANFEKSKSTSQIYTVGELIDNYIENRKNLWSKNTVREYKRTRNIDLAEFTSLTPNDITQELLQSYVNRNSHLAEKTLKNRLSVIRAAISPYTSERLDVKYPQKKKQQIIIPETKEIQEILKFVKGTTLEIPVMLGAMCGLRRSEMCALPPMKDGYLEINQTKVLDDNNEWVIQKRTKTESSVRKIKVPDVLRKKLEEEGYPYIKITPGHITKEFHKKCKALGYDFHFHELRHYCASFLMSLNFPDKYIIQYMGHESDNMVKKVYYHTMKSKQQEVEEKMYATLNATFSL